jgi:hypothetical protein
MLKRRALAALEKPRPQLQFEQIEKILVVVHMHDYFAPCPSCIVNAERELDAAVAADLPIFLSETPPTYFDDNVFLGPGSNTLPCLLAHLKHYRDWKHIMIGETDASVDIFEAMCRRHQEPKVIRILGVETDVCVLEHVESLRLLYPNARIEVVQDACDIGCRLGDPWPRFKELAPQIVLV